MESFRKTDAGIRKQVLVDVVRTPRIAVQILVENQREFKSAADRLGTRRGGNHHGRGRDHGELGPHGVNGSLEERVGIRVAGIDAPFRRKPVVDRGRQAVDGRPANAGPPGVTVASPHLVVVVSVVADVQEEFGGNREAVERIELEDRAEVADMVKVVRGVDEEIPVPPRARAA